ncbi:MAG: asparagine--tRNA ligase [Candidatus Fermentibacteraceae bacterium]|nr:asparagine--tRNA ligase [Candidatus Fermentibacteraceae bacterium]
MIDRTPVVSVLNGECSDEVVVVYGWVRTARSGKNVSFAEISDGSTPSTLQVVFNRDGFEDLSGLATGACIRVKGKVVRSPGQEQSRELEAVELEIVGPAGEDFPLQKKKHSLEFLRSMPHLRVRTNTFGAVFRMSHHLSLAIHRFFDENGFYFIHAPLITTSDAEGAGESFQVTSMPLDRIKVSDGRVDYSEDYFRRKAFLTVSAQLEAEPMALAMGKVYTFGPTFRADPSDTRFHTAEFWMIEPEMAFFDLDDDIALIERFVKYTASYLREKCGEDIGFFSRFYEKELENRYRMLIEGDFARISYSEAIELMQGSGRDFETAPQWGCDIATEYERFLADEHFGSPVFVTDYPASIKPFYMRLNDDGRTVACTDLLFPQVGEIVGGSQREERSDVLRSRALECGIDIEDYSWYFDIRKWGTAPHAGFGLGFERLLMYFTGMENIRDVIPFPRSKGRML